jgi:HK97 family phage major capsid protein
MSEGLLLNGDQQKELTGILAEMKTTYTKLVDENKTLGKAQSETMVKLDKLTDDMSTLHKRVTDDNEKRVATLETQLKRQSEQFTPPKSIGEQVVEDAGFLAAIKSGGRFSVVVGLKGPLARLWQAKDIINLSLQFPQRVDIIAAAARVPIGVRTLVPQGRTTAGAIEYIEETSFTNNAAPVAEGQPKPQSDKVFTPRTVAVRTIAHWFKVSKQTFDDLPFLVTQIENNGVWGVQKVEDNQLLNGSGVAPNLQGFMSIAAAAPAPGGTGATLVDAVGAAVFDLAAKGYMPDGTVMNPADWGTTALLKNSLGNYLFANPMDYTPNARLWGTRVVYTSNMVAGQFLVGAFQGNSQILDREDVNVQVATQNEDDFIKNMVTILVEERLALAIYQPLAFEKGVVPAPALESVGGEGSRTAPGEGAPRLPGSRR